MSTVTSSVTAEAISNLTALLSCSVYSSEPVFAYVRQRLDAINRPWVMLPGNCLFSRGSRADAVVMVAHADTVWCHRRSDVDSMPTTPLEIDGDWIRSGNPGTGIGADDRAGIAAILELADLGHSILITDLEEIGMVGARKLSESGDAAFTDMQKHSFFVQFDRKGATDFKCYSVGTPEFRSYVAWATGLVEPDRYSFTDIVALCEDVAGVNISIGYQHEHTPDEALSIPDWSHMLGIARKWLSEPTPRFELPVLTDTEEDDPL